MLSCWVHIYLEQPVPPTSLSVFLSSYLCRTVSTSNQLNQTVGGQLPVHLGRLRPPLPVRVISLVSAHIVLASRQPGLGNNLGEERGRETWDEV